MRAFVRHSGIVAPLGQENVDTDAIIPKQFMKSILKTGLGEHAFDGWRYLDPGELGKHAYRRPLNPAFVLNQPCFSAASILLTRSNFGCGSSREHAAWALVEFGIQVLIGPSFAEIFRGNCFKNGLLTVVLQQALVDQLFNEVARNPGCSLTVDLQEQIITTPGGENWNFEVPAFSRHCLLNGLDDICLTLRHADRIREFEADRLRRMPWLDRRLVDSRD